MSRKKVKGRTVELGDFLLEGGKPVQAGFVVVQKKIDWADDNNFMPASGLVLPTAPISSRGGHYDESKVPTEPPYTAYLGNLPFDIGEEEIANFFKDLKLSMIRIAKDSADRPKGFGYAEFEDRASLIGALAFDGDEMRNRTIKVSLPEHEDSRGGGFGNRDRMGFGARGERPPERDLGNDWRSSPREDPPGGRGYDGGPSRGDRYGDRGDRDRGGFGDRDRNYGERDREMSRDWRSSEGRGGFESNRSERNYGNRYEPPRDSRDSRDHRAEDGAPSERPKLKLAPRTKPVEPIKVNAEEAPATSPEPPRPKIEKPKASDIFGAAKPVDTAAREREIEAKLAAQAEQAQHERSEKEKRDEPEKSQQRLAENNNESSRPAPRQERSWREESREEKEKRDRKARADRRIPAPQQTNDEEPAVMTSKNKFADLENAENVQDPSENQE